MLTELELRNCGVVADAHLEFGPGLTALTGETGAGKTMLVAGLGLLLGGRGDAGIVRHGQDKAVVQGRWQVSDDLSAQVEELGGELDADELITIRQINAAGRSRASVGGAQVPVGTLGSITESLATIHGQSEQIRLSNPDRQREILDAFAQPTRLDEYRGAYTRRKQLAAELEELVAQEQARAREIDMLSFGLNEIDQAAPEQGEDAALATEAARLQDADDLKLLAVQVQAALSGDESDFDAPNVLGLLGEARKAAAQLSARDTVAADISARLEELNMLLTDVAGDTASYATDLISDPIRLEHVVERQASLAALMRKYGPELDDVLAWAEDARSKLTTLQGADERIERLKAELSDLDEQIAAAGAAIHDDRSRAADELERAVKGELAALAMPHARLVFQLTATDPGPHGTDKVDLLFQANPGSTLAPLAKVASGGELSRVRLALEVILAAEEQGHTFVFDEVDAGVGGAVGLEIGRRLQRLAETSQVIVVTHLAQVAAFADRQFVVLKESDGQVTTSGIQPVTGDGRVAEISRMMSGTPDSDAGAQHASELLKQAGQLG